MLGKNTPNLNAQRKQQVAFKIYMQHRSTSHLSYNQLTNPKLTRISNIPLRFVGSNLELFTEKKSGTTTATKLDLLACDYELSLYRARNLHSYGCEMVPVC